MFTVAMMPIAGDIVATALTTCIFLSTSRFLEKIDNWGLLDQKVYRKLAHMSMGLVFMLCWPMFSNQGGVLAALVPGCSTIKLLLLALGMHKDEATVKYMSRIGVHYRHILKGSIYYLTTLTIACVVYWRTSPVAITTICNLCAGDGIAAIAGRRFGSKKLPYNEKKSIAGTISMVAVSFLASLGYIHYFSTFGYVEKSWQMVNKIFIVSLVGGLVESHPISTELDDNLTVPLVSVIIGSCIF